MKSPSKRRATALVAFVIVAAFVAAPGLVVAYTLLGGMLGIATSGSGYQRDVRIWNNSPDVASNNNTTVDPAYPGAVGAPLAVWKAAKAWGSDNLLAARNFDFDWQGTTTANFANTNTVGWGTTGCGGGTLAYTETPISDGWRIVMCDSFTWADGPGAILGSEFDIQAVVAHELGHALGLGHSASNCGSAAQATMCPSIANGSIIDRDITSDDQAGLQAIYNVIPANKPLITGLSGSFVTGGTLIITGTNFAATVNVKFTAGTSTNTGAIPGAVYGVSSSAGGTQVSVVIPLNALDGNVIVWEPTLNVMSNAFPIDVNYVPPAPPTITSFSPPSVQAFQGGLVTMNGTGFATATQVDVGATVLTGAGFTIVNDTQITFSAPTATALGPVSVTVTGAGGASAPNSYNYVETFPPKLSNSSAVTFSNQGFTWSWGTGANDIVVVLAATDPTTNNFGTPYDILVNYIQVGQAASDPAGIGSYAIVIPPGLSGVTFYSQIAVFEDQGGPFSASNITSSFILF
jgi:IPT/TIG domain/Matrixin